MVAKRSEIYWVAVDPTIGTEIQKTHPSVVVSLDELNTRLDRVIIAPVTSTIRPLRFRVTTTVAGRPSSVVLDQLRTVDVTHLGKRIGKVDARTMGNILTKSYSCFWPRGRGQDSGSWGMFAVFIGIGTSRAAERGPMRFPHLYLGK